MREILFRGKRIDNGEWIYGSMYRISESYNPFIMLVDRCAEAYEVDVNTIGQYTGFKDSKGVMIFEGDLCIDDSDHNDELEIEIVWANTFNWGCRINKTHYVLSKGLTFPLWQWNNCEQNKFRKLEVIGNINERK